MTETLSLEGFHERYAGEKPYFEFWNGEAVQKSFPTLQHSRCQMFVAQLLGCIGYDSGFEITIKLDPAYELVPDVIAAEGRITDPYPTEPFEVVVEILSPDDSFSRVLQKCRLYKTLGIRQVGLVDPNDRVVWSFENGLLQETDIIARRDALVITARQLWAEVDQLYQRPA
jgi:Uma2 family endonuclease